MLSNRFLIRMGIVGLGVAALAVILSPALIPIFKTNPSLNGTIFGVLLVCGNYTSSLTTALPEGVLASS